MKKLEYYIVDVFAKKKYSGNQLAVFFNNENIDQNTMLQIAKEINFAESTFILNGNEKDGFDVKIFTPESEIPFAGHPSVGTAFVIRNLLLKKELKQLTLNLQIGQTKAEFERLNDKKLLTFITQVQPKFNKSFDKKKIADLLNINVVAIDENLPVCEISTGLPFLIVPIKTLDCIRNIKMEAVPLIKFLKANELYKTNNPSGLTSSVFCFTPETYESQNDFNSRMFCVEDGILKEDAATGSANGCFLAYYLKFIQPSAMLSMEQGFEMGRPSHLKLQGFWKDNQFDLKVGGTTQLIAKGEWFV